MSRRGLGAWALVVAMLAFASVGAAGCEHFGRRNTQSAPPAAPPRVVQVIVNEPRPVMIYRALGGGWSPAVATTQTDRREEMTR
jgi:hypothetical protein